MLSEYVPALSIVLIFWLVLLLKEFTPMSRLATLRINCLSVAAVGVLTGTAMIGVFVPLIKFQGYF